jgi:hypothetical protein
MTRLNIDAFTRFFQYYQGLPHQNLAIATLWKAMPVSLLEDDADWVEQYRDPAIDEDADVPILTGNEPALSWGGVMAMAKKAGAKFSECVAAQVVLESGWFKHETGAFNVLGIKAAPGEPYSDCTTWEHVDGKDITIVDKFKDFDSYEACIKQLVDQWYKDYRGYRGVNRAESANECARLLVVESYATDVHYADKLIRIMKQQSG